MLKTLFPLKGNIQNVRVPIRSIILNASPILHGIEPFARQEIIQNLKQKLRQHPLHEGQLIDTGKGIHIVWDWGECAQDDIDLATTTEASGILAQFHHKTPPQEIIPLLQNRKSHPQFQQGLESAVHVAHFIKDLCYNLSTKTHDNGSASWQARFNLKTPITCRFGLCHGKLFNLGDRLSGLSLDVATDIARMAPEGTLACGPIICHSLKEAFQNKKTTTIGNQLIASAQIECPLWQVEL